MAYTNTFNFEFKSNADIAYRLEIWDQGTGASSYNGIEGTLGKNAAKISYNSKRADMYAPIKTSTLSIDFLVTDVISAAYISALRTNRQERDVYVYLYLTGTSHTVGPIPSTNRPVFAGFLLMDLSDDPDVSVPFNIKLKAVDGLASLKYYDFVPNGTTQSPDNLYEIDETWIPDATNGYPTYRTFILWISKILSYSGFATTTTGAAQEAKIKTSCNWFNGQMMNTTLDPLLHSRTKALQWYEKQGDTGNIKYKALNCYEALEAILVAWGLRIVCYRNVFNIISINNYTNNESGTLANPVNIDYHLYSMLGVYDSDGDSLDYFWGRYNIPISNIPTSPTVNQKLSGTNFNLLPPFKKVSVDFLTVSNYNFFNGFPLLPDPWPINGSAQAYTEFKEIGIFDFDGLTNRTFYTEVWLDIINNSVDGDIEFESKFTLQAREVGSTGNWLQWGLNGTPVPQWVSSTPQPYVGAEFSLINTLPNGASTINIATPVGGSFGSMRAFIVFPTSAFPAGSYEIRYKIAANWSNIINTSSYVEGHGACMSVNNPNSSTMSPDDNLVTYGLSNTSVGIGTSVFSELELGAISSSNTSTQVIQPGADTQEFEVKNVKFGDTFLPTAAAYIEVNTSPVTGGVWVGSGFAGFWGVDTLAGGFSLAENLAQQILKRQYKTVRKANMTISMGLNYTNSDSTGTRPIYPMPISKFFTPSHSSSGTLSANWIMHSADWFPVKDEWAFDLFEFEDFTTTSTTTTTDFYTGISGNTGNPGETPTPGGSQAKIGNFNNPNKLAIENIYNNLARPIASVSANQLIDDTVDTSQTITSLDVLAMPEALLKIGDTIVLQAQNTPPTNSSDSNAGTLEYGNIVFTVSANQLAAATTISVTSKLIYQNISIGDHITISQPDLISQYQNKTKGTIAGMEVSATRLDGAASIGRNQVFFRADGNNLTDGNYYVLNGEDNNKSGRFQPSNTDAPSAITTTKAFKSMKLIADSEYSLESGQFIGTGTSGWPVQIILYKTTPVDDTFANTTMTLLGKYSISLGGDSTTKVVDLTIDSADINKGDIIVPHLYADPSTAPAGSFDFRGGIVFTLIRK